MARERKGTLRLPAAGAHATGARAHATSSDVLLRELLATLAAELRRAAARGNEQAMRLESIAGEAEDCIGDLQVDEPSAELLYRAHRLRGLVLNTLVLLADFQLVAGKLETIAALRQALVSSE